MNGRHTRWAVRLTLGLGLLFAPGARAADLEALLAKGPVVLLEDDAAGKFGQATGVIKIDAAPEKVWAALIDFERWTDFVPKVTTSHVVRRSGNEVDVHFVIDVPGPDSDYVVRYALDEAKRSIKANWVKGDLKGSRWSFQVDPSSDGKTLLSHTLSVKNFSSFAQSLEDESQTLTIGVNVGSVLAVTKALKRKAEAKPAPPPAHN